MIISSASCLSSNNSPVPIITRTRKPIQPPALLRCLRLEDHGGLNNNGVDTSQKSSSSQSETQVTGTTTSTSSSHVWQLFTEAQQNIMYMNKQRLVAVEELAKAKEEIRTLRQIIEEKSVSGGHEIIIANDDGNDQGGDELSNLWELLLRIDSMVLMGMIDTKDASDLRKLVKDSHVNLVDPVVPLLQKRDPELLLELRLLLEQSKRSGYHIIHVCTEMDPVVTVGSLGSYVTGLSQALQRKGNLVEVILPKYQILDLTEVHGLRETQAELYSYFNGQLHGNKIWTGVVQGIGVTFIEPVYYSSFFNREMVYGYADDFERFMYFSRASLDYIVKSGKHPDILHLHNWETAVAAPLFWDIFVNQGLTATKILLTSQDFSSQCLEPPEKLGLCGLDPSRLNRADRLQDNIKQHLVNVLKGGIIYSNKFVVMSSTYSKEKIIQSLGHGLEPTLSAHKSKMVVAPYGYDNSCWDPSRDKFLPENFSVGDMKGKAVCKASLQGQLGLRENASSILVGCLFYEITDMDLENLMGILQIASVRGVQFIFMGESQLPSISAVLDSLQEDLKDENVRFLNKYDEALSHLILGGSDIILCHTYEDPVLQLPLKAMRYGAAPILITSIEKRFRQFVVHEHGSTQFSRYISAFSNMSLMQALSEIRNMPTQWNQMMEEAMSKDFSWDAECYDVHISAYESIKNL